MPHRWHTPCGILGKSLKTRKHHRHHHHPSSIIHHPLLMLRCLGCCEYSFSPSWPISKVNLFKIWQPRYCIEDALHAAHFLIFPLCLLSASCFFSSALFTCSWWLPYRGFRCNFTPGSESGFRFSDTIRPPLKCCGFLDYLFEKK